MVVVLLSIDLVALLILSMLDASLFSGTDVTIGSNSGLLTIDVRLASLKVCGFFVSERAGLDTLLDTVLLIDVALHIGLHALGRDRIRIAAHGVVI